MVHVSSISLDDARALLSLFFQQPQHPNLQVQRLVGYDDANFVVCMPSEEGKLAVTYIAPQVPTPYTPRWSALMQPVVTCIAGEDHQKYVLKVHNTADSHQAAPLEVRCSIARNVEWTKPIFLTEL
jgi:hypothetical protein